MYKEVFKRFMELVKLLMKQQGFTSRDNNFHKRHPQGNIGLINFQKNRDGFPKFTINVGVYSLVLAKYCLAEFNRKEVKKYPSLGDFHWETRIGSLVPEQHPSRKKDEFWLQVGDKWWWYNEQTDINELFEEISKLILNYAIPAIDSHLSDQQLIDSWLAQAGTGGPDRLKYLCALLKESGDKEQLNKVLHEFGQFMQIHPELTGLKKHYDRFMREAIQKREFYDEEVSSSTNHSSKKMKP